MKFPKLAAIGALLVLGAYWVGGRDAVRAQADKAKSDKDAKAPAEPKDIKQQASYAFGLRIGRSVAAQYKNFEFDPESIGQGFKDAFSGAKPRLTDDEMLEALEDFEDEQIIKQGGPQAKDTEKNRAVRKEGREFLAANKTKPGVKTLPSGLQYKVLKEGDGPKPKATDKVRANYRGTLVDGTEFDSSEKHGGPAEFAVNRVIPGWTEALQLMKVGSKWQLFIPAKLAYGAKPPFGSKIPPNSALIFDVELVGIERGD
jgi:FKBP-type peptidyl-prolyl cis-trans isomerase